MATVTEVGLQNLARAPLFSTLLGAPPPHPLSSAVKTTLLSWNTEVSTNLPGGKNCNRVPKQEKVGALGSHPLSSGPSVCVRPILGTLYLLLGFQKLRVAK